MVSSAIAAMLKDLHFLVLVSKATQLPDQKEVEDELGNKQPGRSPPKSVPGFREGTLFPHPTVCAVVSQNRILSNLFTPPPTHPHPRPLENDAWTIGRRSWLCSSHEPSFNSRSCGSLVKPDQSTLLSPPIVFFLLLFILLLCTAEACFHSRDEFWH